MCKGNFGNVMKCFWYVGFFNYVNDNTNVDIENPQIMHYIFCPNNPINATNPRTQFKKGIISYYKTKWNNIFEKTCECKSWSNCQSI